MVCWWEREVVCIILGPVYLILDNHMRVRPVRSVTLTGDWLKAADICKYLQTRSPP